jgi:hypothetical protein
LGRRGRFVARHRLVRGFAQVAEKNRLAAVGVARPFVEDQHPGEVMQVFHLAQLLVGKKIMQCELPGISGIARAELQPGLAWNPRAWQLHGQFRGQPDQLLRDGDNLHQDRG